MKKMKKNIKIFMMLAVLLINTTMQVAASKVSDEKNDLDLSRRSVDSILEEYDKKILEQSKTDNMSRNNDIKAKEDLINERNQLLRDAGYEVYTVNKENKENIEKTLNTDLNSLGFEQDDELLIVVSGESSGMTTMGTAGSSFNFTYYGNTYSMRYLTVQAHDPEAHSSFKQSSAPVEIIKTKSSQLINEALNSVIALYLDSFYSGLGTVMSFIGVDVADIGYENSSTLSIGAGSNWTRVYTQYYSDYDQMWLNGSAVEKVNAQTLIIFRYYSPEATKYVTNVEEINEPIESDKYDNTTWKKQQAAIAAYYGSGVRHDSTGAVRYYYDGEEIFKHNAPPIY